MDSHSNNVSVRDRSTTASSYNRVPSRASASTSSSRHTFGTSTSSPKQSSIQLAQRYQAAKNASRPATSLSRDTADSSTDSPRAPVISSYLQEMLQKERRTEDQTGSRRTPDIINDALHHSAHSPARSGSSDPRRPGSSGGSDGQGLGVRSMGQAVSNLHKQNFDLKLELHHRRERQEVLEKQVDDLKGEQNELKKANQELQLELEKRDKAVEEAVAMIVLLESQVDALINEREISRRAEEYRNLYSRPTVSAAMSASTPTSITPTLATVQSGSSSHTPRQPGTPEPGNVSMRTVSGERTLNRVPSFLSEKSDTTENLRNVYLGRKGSVLSLARVNEGSEAETDALPQDIGSPNLSILSESSFTSIYGKEPHQNQEDLPQQQMQQVQDAVLPPPHEPLDDVVSQHLANITQQPQRMRLTCDPLYDISDGSPTASAHPSPSPSSAAVVNQNRADRLERSHAVRLSPSRQLQNPIFSEDLQISPTRRKTKEEKRASLRNVQTETSRTLLDQALPPTPSTISTSTLRRYKNSNDALDGRSHNMDNKRSSLVLDYSSTPSSMDKVGPRIGQISELAMAHHKASQQGTCREYWEQHIPHMQRPRSAGETTVSRRVTGWDSDRDSYEDGEEDDEDADTRSLGSSVDIWMREGWKPTIDSVADGRHSPSLFDFPPKSMSTGWGADAMLGPRPSLTTRKSRSKKTKRSHRHPSGRSRKDDSYGPSPPSATWTPDGPSPPNRRSSLHPKSTSSTPSKRHHRQEHESHHDCPTTPSKSSPNSSQHRQRRRSSRHHGNSEDAMRIMTQCFVPSPTESSSSTEGQQQQQTQKQSSSHARSSKTTTPATQYPPITGQQPATSRTRGLNNLFRRSIGAAPIPAPSPIITDNLSAQGHPHHPVSWLPPHAIDDDRTGATPPPILRNRNGSSSAGADMPVGKIGHGHHNSMDISHDILHDHAMNMAPATPTSGGAQPIAADDGSHTPATPATSSRRKWLSKFGRSSIGAK